MFKCVIKSKLGAFTGLENRSKNKASGVLAVGPIGPKFPAGKLTNFGSGSSSLGLCEKSSSYWDFMNSAPDVVKYMMNIG